MNLHRAGDVVVVDSRTLGCGCTAAFQRLGKPSCRQ